MTESISSAYSSSRAATSSLRLSAASDSFSETVGSFSTSLTAYHLFLPSGTLPDMAVSALETSSSMRSSNLSPLGASPFCAAETTASTSSLVPSFLRADMGTTGHPSLLDRASVSMDPPFFLTASIMFRATTVGMPVSSICRVRNRFLSMLVASTMLMTASGLPSIRKFLVTISSGE